MLRVLFIMFGIFLATGSAYASSSMSTCHALQKWLSVAENAQLAAATWRYITIREEKPLSSHSLTIAKDAISRLKTDNRWGIGWLFQQPSEEKLHLLAWYFQHPEAWEDCNSMRVSVIFDQVEKANTWSEELTDVLARLKTEAGAGNTTALRLWQQWQPHKLSLQVVEAK